MEGIFHHKNKINSDGNEHLPQGIELLAKNGNVEIMEQTILAEAPVWLYPADTPDTMEFFFIHRGSLELSLDEGPVVFSAGESFTVQGLKREVAARALQETSLIYVSNQPMFEDAADFEEYIRKLIAQINEKDQYTYLHSANVMTYSTLLYRALSTENGHNDAVLNDMVVASLFHDVGKCFTPDEILKKKGFLTDEERRIICHHPVDSARLLRRYYSERVAEIAAHHHERLDGTGYPYGLSDDEISPEARIVAVADAFDAMTTNRGYNRVKSYKEAAEELRSMPKQYDSTVTAALCRLVEENALPQRKKEET